MNKPVISLIACISKNRALGKDNDLIWKIPLDQKRYLSLTTGHPLIMGRKTYESIGRPLPNRTNIVITHDQNYHPEGVIVVHSYEDAIAEAKKVETEEIFINGGAQIYTEAIAKGADKIYLTLVDQETPADVYFPDYSEYKTEVFQENHEENGIKFSFIDLVK
nr:Dihydrofolate reductase [uncultured bacterium]